MIKYPWLKEHCMPESEQITTLHEAKMREHAEAIRKYEEFSKRKEFAEKEKERKAMQVAMPPPMPKVEMDFKEAMARMKFFEEQNKPEVDRLEKKQAVADQKTAEESKSPEERAQAAVKEAVKMLKRGR